MKTSELKGLAGRREVENPAREAARRFAARAELEGLLDVAYGFVDSPFGRLFVATTGRGIVRLSYPEHPVDGTLEELSARLSPRVLESPRATGQVRRELEEYFEGRRRSFEVPVDLVLAHGFVRRVLSATTRIAFGKVASYRDVAARAGNQRAVRAAGNALGSNPIPIVVPCHRVVRTSGGLGGYTGGLDRKVTLLTLEGALT